MLDMIFISVFQVAPGTPVYHWHLHNFLPYAIAHMQVLTAHPMAS